MNGYTTLGRLRTSIGDFFDEEIDAEAAPTDDLSEFADDPFTAEQDATFEEAVEANAAQRGSSPPSYEPQPGGPEDASANTLPESPSGPGSTSPTPAPPLPPSGTPTAGADTNDEQIALLQQNVDDAEYAYDEAMQANLDALDEFWKVQQSETSTSSDIKNAQDLVKPLAAALVPAYDAVVAARKALAAASTKTVAGAPPPPKTPSAAVQSAKTLHNKTVPVHTQTTALHTLIQANKKPMTAATKAKAKDLAQHRKQLAQARKTVKQALQAEIAKKKRTSPPGVQTTPSTSTATNIVTVPKTKSVVNLLRAPGKPPKPKIHGDVMNGYTILGETIGEGFDLLSMFSGFLGGGKKSEPAGPTPAQQMMQMQLQQQQAEAQRAREAAARATTLAWTFGGLAGIGLLGTVLWKALK